MSDDFANNTGTTGSLSVNGHVTGAIETAGDVDWFRLALDPDHAYRISAITAQGTEPEIYLFNQTRQWMEYSNMPGMLGSNELSNPFGYIFAGHEYFLQVASKTATTYTIGLTEAADDYGNSSASARALAPDQRAEANFDYAFDSEVYRIAATAGVTYTVTVAADAIAADALLRLEQGNDMRQGGQGQRAMTYSFTATESRSYDVKATLMAVDAPAAPAHYRVSVSAADRSPPKVLSATGTVDGPIRIVFDEAIKLGSGTIKIGDVEFAVDSAALTVEGNALVVDTAGWRLPATYFISFRDGSVLDGHGNAVVQTATWAEVKNFTHGNLVRFEGSWLGSRLEGTAASNDIVLFTGRQSTFAIASEDGKVTVSNAQGGHDELTGVERLYFTEGGDAVALSLAGNLGQVYRLYQAAFDRTPDKGGLGYWLAASDDGMDLAVIARQFIGSQEFGTLYGTGPSNAAFVDALYHNILHRAGDTGGIAYWNDVLAHGADRANVLVTFSESAENVAAVTLGSGGFVYTMY